MEDRKDIKVVIKKKGEDDYEDLNYWKNKTPEERLAGLEILRKRYCDYMGYDYGYFHRVYKIIKRK